jgi:hypothetical protein
MEDTYKRTLCETADNNTGPFQCAELLESLDIRLSKYDELKNTLTEMIKEISVNDEVKMANENSPK